MAVETDYKEIVRHMNDEVWAEGNLDLVDEYIADGYVEHNSASPEPIRGPEGYKENVQMVRAAFPDLAVTTEHLVAEGDEVGFRYTMTGTHHGQLMGIEPTEREMTITGMAIAQFEDGKMVEDWSIVDIYGMMQQLGVVDPP